MLLKHVLRVEIWDEICEKKAVKASGMGFGLAWAIGSAIAIGTDDGEVVGSEGICIITSSKEFNGGPTEMSVRGSMRAWLGGRNGTSEACGVVECSCSHIGEDK
jgi:hypothetical protein